MQLVFVFGAIGIGFLITLHISMNAHVGLMTQNAHMANAMFWLIGSLSAVIFSIVNWDQNFVKQVMEVPKWLLLAGAMGAFIAIASNILIPKVGIYEITILYILGQLLSSMAFSHFGWFTVQNPVNWVKLCGAALALTGAVFITYGKVPFLSD